MIEIDLKIEELKTLPKEIVYGGIGLDEAREFAPYRGPIVAGNCQTCQCSSSPCHNCGNCGSVNSEANLKLNKQYKT